MKSQTITANYLRTICWKDDTIIDWAEGGQQYSLNSAKKQLGKYHFPLSCDSAVSSANGEYVFIYKRLGTKGLLLRNGELVREINRSYYYAHAYEFPVCFITSGNKTYLVHCPISYKQLDFEDVETGEIITNVKGREPHDKFHSRLEVNPGGTLLMSKGWLWHPLDEINVYDIKQCLKNPFLLDSSQFSPDVHAEICTASFINDHDIIIGSSDEVLDEENIGQLPPKHISVWNLKTDQLSKPIKVKEDFGNLFAINANYAWDLYDFPKIIDLSTGAVIEENREISSGKQNNSFIGSSSNFPSIIFNRQTKQIAIKGDEKIKVLTPDFNLL